MVIPRAEHVAHHGAARSHRPFPRSRPRLYHEDRQFRAAPYQMIRRREAYRPRAHDHDIVPVVPGHIFRTTLGLGLKSLSLAGLPREELP